MAKPGGAQQAFDLIITVVSKGRGHLVLEASRDAGAEGGTVFHARGAGIHEQKKILGIPIEPEKEVVFTLLPSHLTDQVFDAIVAAAELDKPGHGIAFVLEAKRVAGITHLLEGSPRENGGGG